MAQNPEFMAAIGKSFANQTATLSRMVEDDREEEDEDMVFECATCHFVIAEENMSYSDNTCPHCGSTMYRYEKMLFQINISSNCIMFSLFQELVKVLNQDQVIKVWEVNDVFLYNYSFISLYKNIYWNIWCVVICVKLKIYDLTLF